MNNRIFTVIAEAIDSTSDAISIWNPHTPDHDAPSQRDFRRIKLPSKKEIFKVSNQGNSVKGGITQPCDRGESCISSIAPLEKYSENFNLGGKINKIGALDLNPQKSR
jgi:hypothetical protein